MIQKYFLTQNYVTFVYAHSCRLTFREINQKVYTQSTECHVLTVDIYLQNLRRHLAHQLQKHVNDVSWKNVCFTFQFTLYINIVSEMFSHLLFQPKIPLKYWNVDYFNHFDNFDTAKLRTASQQMNK